MEYPVEIVKGLAVIGESGVRLIGTPLCISEETRTLEVKLFSKAKETDEGILFMDPYMAAYKIVEDICIIIYAPVEENEIIIKNSLDAFYSAVLKIVKGALNEKTLKKHYDEIFLVIDSFIYKGLILSDNSADISGRVPRRTFEGLDAVQIPSKFSNALKKAQKSFTSSWFKK